MTEKHVVIIGGGLAGLSAGCYARANGFRTTIVEHNLALGGVCTAWSRGPYTIDGCIQWLAGGPFKKIYEELGILPRVPFRTMERFVTYRDQRGGTETTISWDLEATARAFREIAPEDGDEIQRIMEGAERLVDLEPSIDRPAELSTMRDQLSRLWKMRSSLGLLAHFRKPIGVYSAEHLKSERLQRLLSRILPDQAPTAFLLMVLGYLKHGYLSRPEGGSGALRDALIETYRRAGGESVLHSTVDEVLVEGSAACGVRLGDGTILGADIVISTASAPETVLRLLGGRYGAAETRERLERWKLFQPIVLASYGLATPLEGVPPTLLIDNIAPLMVGGVKNEHLYVRVFNEGAGFAPSGHTVVQMLLTTDYDYWATRGSHYNAEKDLLAKHALKRLDVHVPGIEAAVRVSDVATPLTFWNAARSWRGAYEGWMPSSEAMLSHIDKKLPGLAGFYMAGQWVEPGGGIPTALMSGRQVTQLLCADEGRSFDSNAAGTHASFGVAS